MIPLPLSFRNSYGEKKKGVIFNTAEITTAQSFSGLCASFYQTNVYMVSIWK